MSRTHHTRRRALSLIACGLLFGTACSGNDGGATNVVADAQSGTAGITGVIGGEVVAGSDGTGWLVGKSTGRADLQLFRFTDSDITPVVDLPAMQGTDAFAFESGMLLGGVRCETVECESTIAEIVFVSPDGAIDNLAVIDRHGGAPNDADAIRIVGNAGGNVWVTDLGGRLLGVDREGSTVARLDPPGEACVIASELYRLHSDSPPQPPDVVPGKPAPAEEIAEEPVGFTVSRWDGEALQPVKNGHLDQSTSAGRAGFCAADGFEVRGAQFTSRWTPQDGWTQQAAAPFVPDARSGTAESDTRRQYVVDASGALLVLADQKYQPTTIRFGDLPEDGPPAGLAVDDAGGRLVACLATSGSNGRSSSLECEIG